MMSKDADPTGYPVEKIVGAAARLKGRVFAVSPPGRHRAVLDYMMEVDVSVEGVCEADQGFVTSTGRYVDRKEALLIAVAANQIIEKTGPADTLFSEDIF